MVFDRSQAFVYLQTAFAERPLQLERRFESCRSYRNFVVVDVVEVVVRNHFVEEEIAADCRTCLIVAATGMVARRMVASFVVVARKIVASFVVVARGIAARYVVVATGMVESFVVVATGMVASFVVAESLRLQSILGSDLAVAY